MCSLSMMSMIGINEANIIRERCHAAWLVAALILKHYTIARPEKILKACRHLRVVTFAGTSSTFPSCKFMTSAVSKSVFKADSRTLFYVADDSE